MLLSPSGSEFYNLTIITSPQLTSWEASFDNGATWVAAQTDSDPTHYFWLVKGPLSTSTTGSPIALATDVQPLIRATATPEVLVREPPYIALSTMKAS